MSASANIKLKLHDETVRDYYCRDIIPGELSVQLASASFWKKTTSGLKALDENAVFEFLKDIAGASADITDNNPDYVFYLDSADYGNSYFYRNSDPHKEKFSFLSLCAHNIQNNSFNRDILSYVNEMQKSYAVSRHGLGPNPSRTVSAPAHDLSGCSSLIKWTLRYFEIAELVSTWSKDPSTKVGAIIVGDKGQIIAQGYNGFPRGVEDRQERYDQREIKYKFVVHAEMNAILNALYNGSSVVGASIYIHNLPVCQECAKAIIQAGIARVFIDTSVNERWGEAWEISKTMFNESGVRCYYFDVKEMKVDRII